MSETLSSLESNTDLATKLLNLRQFRFQKKQIRKYTMSDDDSNQSDWSNQTRRNIVNRIEDSDSDVENPQSIGISEIENLNKDQQVKLKYLITLFPNKDATILKEILNDVNWNLNKAKEILFKNKKRPLPDSNVKSKKCEKPKKKRKKHHEEEDVDIDSDEKHYEDKVFDSDEDSDVEVSNELVGDKKAVLEFMQTALESELLAMHKCSQKKAEAIIETRPFEDWRDLVYKFQHNKHLNTELLNSAQTLLASRNVVENLMKKCLRLSTNVEKAVAAGSATLKEQPTWLSSDVKLFPYQMVGLNWLAVMHSQNMNSILADEMGLGKTVQVIAFLTYLKESNLIEDKDGPHMIVVPKTTKDNWKNELEKWSPKLKVFEYYGSQEERRDMRMGWRHGDLDDIDIILTTYTLLSSTPEERRLFRVMSINYIVFDEAHMLKNMSTIRYESLVKINAKRRILLTGTPLQNNLLELMSLLIFLMPSIFAGKQNELKFLFSKNLKLKEGEQSLFEQHQVKNAKEIMRPFILRRLKSEVLQDLPKKTNQVIKCTMTKEQQRLYDASVAELTAENNQDEKVNTSGLGMELRKLANHPLLVRNYYDEQKLEHIANRLAEDPSYKEKDSEKIFEDLLWKYDYQINELTRKHKCIAGMCLSQELILQAGKFQKLDELLPSLKDGGHRVLIFSQFVMMLDILEEYLTIKHMKYLRLDGSTPDAERQSLINEFTDDDEIFIFLLSTRAGGLGINLTAADTVIIYDIDYNPYNDKQAEDRCHRVRQEKPVHIIRLLSEGTIDEEMYEIAQKKLHLEKQITDNEEKENPNKKGVVKLLKMTLKLDNESSNLLTVKGNQS